MLVLSRKSSETIVINGEITIHVLRIRGGSIHIGIDAPPNVSVRRGELTPLGAPPVDPSARSTRRLSLAKRTRAVSA